MNRSPVRGALRPSCLIAGGGVASDSPRPVGRVPLVLLEDPEKHRDRETADQGLILTTGRNVTAAPEKRSALPRGLGDEKPSA